MLRNHNGFSIFSRRRRFRAVAVGESRSFPRIRGDGITMRSLPIRLPFGWVYYDRDVGSLEAGALGATGEVLERVRVELPCVPFFELCTRKKRHIHSVIAFGTRGLLRIGTIQM